MALLNINVNIYQKWIDHRRDDGKISADANMRTSRCAFAAIRASSSIGIVLEPVALLDKTAAQLLQ